MKLKIFTKKRILIIILFVYIFLALIYRDVYGIFGYKISPFLLLGFFLIILSFLVFVNLNHKKANSTFIEFKFFSENLINIIILTLMSISLFIPAKGSSSLITLWDNLSFLNYFRVFICILGCTFLPGSSLYRMIFKNDFLSSKFKINPLFIKITLYPLISFGFIGISVLIFDQINLNGELIGLFLFILILSLFLLGLILEKKRDNSINMKITKINISKYTFIVLLLAFGVSTISIGFQIDWEYLISGDPWDAIKYAKYVGDPGGSPLYIDYYPNFWGYVSFGLSILGGMPYININTCLAPFSYLFITSTYMLMKALLYRFNTKYIVFSTILMSIFSGIFLNPLVSPLIFASEYYYIYKSFSYFSFFVSLAIFLVLINNNSTENNDIGNKIKSQEFKFIILSSVFIGLSFMTYVFPLFFGIAFLFLYCLFSRKNRRYLNFKYYRDFILLIFLFLLIFDLCLNFYLSYIIINWLLRFFNYEFIRNVMTIVPAPLLTYALFSIFLLIISIINLLVFKDVKRKEFRKRRLKLTFKTTFQLFLIIFTFFILIEFSSIILEFLIPNFNLSENSFFFLYLDKIFLNLGVIGILGIYLSYYCWKKEKFLFLTLIFWVLLTFILAFLKISLEFVENFPSSPKDLSESNIFMMDYWFDRIWFYSIPSLCIFASIGLFRLFEKIKQYRILNKIKLPPLLSKNIIVSTLILFSSSGILITGFVYGDSNFRFTNTQIETLGWISENIPIYSGVIVGDNFFMGVGTDSITFVRQYFFYEIFKGEYNGTKCIDQIGVLKNNTIQYAIISQFFISYFLNKSDFTNNILIPSFYNVTLYQDGDLSIHYAPYFD